MTYEPKNRVSAIQALCSPFFDELRDSKFVLKSEDGVAVQNAPPLFNFGGPEIRYVTSEMAEKLIPEHHRDASNWPPVLGDKALEGIRTSSKSSESRGKEMGTLKSKSRKIIMNTILRTIFVYTRDTRNCIHIYMHIGLCPYNVIIVTYFCLNAYCINCAKSFFFPLGLVGLD